MGSAAYNQVFRMNLPVDNPARPLPSGDAFFIRRGQALRVRIADPLVGPVPLTEWVRKIQQR
jgi:hypothetical protein